MTDHQSLPVGIDSDTDSGTGRAAPGDRHRVLTPHRSGRPWVDVVGSDQLTPGRGVAALVDGHQVAIFLVDSGDVFAVDNHDPFSGAYVLSRGIVGDRDGVLKVASPIYKQSFDLRTGRCLDDESVQIATYPVRVSNGRVEVAVL